MRFSLDHALRNRGGVKEVRRRSTGHPTHFGIRIDFNLGDLHGYYALAIGTKKGGAYHIQKEACGIEGPEPAEYSISGGEVQTKSLAYPPGASPHRLYLGNLQGIETFRRVYDALSSMGFYNLNPSLIRSHQNPDPRSLLARDGGNAASVLANLAAHSPYYKSRIEEYLSKVAPGVTAVNRKSVGSMETLEFRQQIHSAGHPWRFNASNMSDGTIRALGVLLALFSSLATATRRPALVGIEEPELALHPAAAGVLVDALRESARHAQVLVASHSPDLLNDDISDNSIIVVHAEEGESRIGPLDQVGRATLRDHLYTAGELFANGPADARPETVDSATQSTGAVSAFCIHMIKVVPIVEGHGEVEAVPIQKELQMRRDG